MMTAAGQALWAPTNPSGNGVSDDMHSMQIERVTLTAVGGRHLRHAPALLALFLPADDTSGCPPLSEISFCLQEHCVHALADSGNLLNDVSCGRSMLSNNPLSACCQAPILSDTTIATAFTPTPISSPRAVVCPEGFSNPAISAAGTIFCYAVAAGVNGAGLTWHQALVSCESKGAQLGSLAAIRDLAQKTAVLTNRCSGLILATNPSTYW
jgi:hypothetical protein